MLETKLTTCASLLYQWIQRQAKAGEKLKIDLQDFQAWTGEYREKPYSDREIFDALKQLKELHCIKLARTEVTLEVQRQCAIANQPLPTEFMAQEPERSQPWVLIPIAIVTSLALGLIPILSIFFHAQADISTFSQVNPWSVLADKNVD